jgi:nucleoside triphosphate diphosphatase
MQELLAIMARLRAADGCPWDREQTFASIAPHTLEEAYEVVDAIERRDMPHLKDELGDLLFQVVFHAQIASEAGEFDFDAVAAAICDKLKRRHPHVFGGAAPMTAAEQSVVWENIKAAERRANSAKRATTLGDDAGANAGRAATHSHLDGVPLALPALMRAFKLSKRAARVGFDFEHASQTADKVAEELAEVRDAAEQSVNARRLPVNSSEPSTDTFGPAANPSGPSAAIVEEIGDLLFAAANLARKLDVDAETALRSANLKFERRFRGMEALAEQRGVVFAELNLEAQERLWQEVKRGE